MFILKDRVSNPRGSSFLLPPPRASGSESEISRLLRAWEPRVSALPLTVVSKRLRVANDRPSEQDSPYHSPDSSRTLGRHHDRAPPPLSRSSKKVPKGWESEQTSIRTRKQSHGVCKSQDQRRGPSREHVDGPEPPRISDPPRSMGYRPLVNKTTKRRLLGPVAHPTASHQPTQTVLRFGLAASTEARLVHSSPFLQHEQIRQ
ncbi:hypothetical protein CDEST_06778 [Colletotrichum destructivum]|uniref:Uncharacterized protein n=1 Tax=Colletotrichum destructivum TaxID=34406 RepID=A0AAX4IER0_9PEZI|nr:hypothetical protein CDEST_06778 [Colletotrichum destructivum]